MFCITFDPVLSPASVSLILSVSPVSVVYPFTPSLLSTFIRYLLTIFSLLSAFLTFFCPACFHIRLVLSKLSVILPYLLSAFHTNFVLSLLSELYILFSSLSCLRFLPFTLSLLSELSYWSYFSCLIGLNFSPLSILCLTIYYPISFHS